MTHALAEAVRNTRSAVGKIRQYMVDDLSHALQLVVHGAFMWEELPKCEGIFEMEDENGNYFTGKMQEAFCW